MSDKKIGIPSTSNPNIIDHYEADVVSASDYYPFGMQMPGRNVSAGSYRYGFNGKEMDNEISGDGNQYDYGFRIYNPRLGKFLSVDPLTKEYPWYTPYQFAGNKPIWAIDLDGLEEWTTTGGQTVSGPYTHEYAKENGWTPKSQSNTSTEKSYLPPLLGDMKLEEPWEKNKPKTYHWDEVIDGKHYDVSTTVDFQQGVGEAKGATSIIPIYGTGRNAINDFQNGRYIGGTINGIMAISDIFLVKSLFQGVAKGGLKALTYGNKPWSRAPWQGDSYRSLYLETGFVKPGEPAHHWLIHQNGPIGKYVPNGIKNQMFNLQNFSSQAEHMIYGHGQNYLGQSGANTLGQLWHGTPTWPKLFTLSYGGRGLQFGLGNNSSNSNTTNQ